MYILCCEETELIPIFTITRNIMQLIQIIVPILLIIMISVNLVQLINNPDLKNGKKKLFNKAFAAIIVFMVPIIVDAFLAYIPSSISVSECWNEVKERKFSTSVDYVSIYDGEKASSIINNPNDYEKGNKKDSKTSSNSNNPSKANTGTSGVTGADIVAYAEKFVGKPYKRGGSWNGEMPYTPTDCVGFVKGVYKHFGIKIPSNASTLINNSKKFTVVTGQPVQAGDIVLYDHHRALITGKGNKVVHAMGEAYGIGHSKNYKSCGAGAVRAVIRVNALSQ